MYAQSTNYSKKQGTKVSLPWTHGRDDMEGWNEICAWTIETFGLPGDRWEWHATFNTMDFIFKDEIDAIRLMLRWS